MGTVFEWANSTITILLQYGEKSKDSEGFVVHYLNFQVKKRQSSFLNFAIIKFSHSKTVPILSRKAVEVSYHRTISPKEKFKLYPIKIHIPKLGPQAAER